MLSLVCGILFIAFRAGISATSYGATDSAGRTMGFNDDFSVEHYGIILENVSIIGTFEFMEAYEYVFLGIHLLAIGLLLRNKPIQMWLITFFAIQPLIFPWGFLGILYVPIYLKMGLALSLDREMFIDNPFVWLTAHAVWIVAATFSAWRLFRAR